MVKNLDTREKRFMKGMTIRRNFVKNIALQEEGATGSSYVAREVQDVRFNGYVGLHRSKAAGR